jgi:hypothetical protein
LRAPAARKRGGATQGGRRGRPQTRAKRPEIGAGEAPRHPNAAMIGA